MRASHAYIGLGSNLELPERQIRGALNELARLPATRLLQASRLYHSAPMGGPEGQPDYVNAVAALETELAPLELLDAMLDIEQAHGRVRTEHWGPRTLDLDLLLFDDLTLKSERLILPHPGVTVRNFVLIPLAEIAPDLVLPGGGKVSELARAISREGLRPLRTQGA